MPKAQAEVGYAVEITVGDGHVAISKPAVSPISQIGLRVIRSSESDGAELETYYEMRNKPRKEDLVRDDTRQSIRDSSRRLLQIKRKNFYGR